MEGCRGKLASHIHQLSSRFHQTLNEYSENN